MEESCHYDVIVIGAGLGGLGAAMEASRKGKKVLLLEQHNLPGGFATSFVRGRFEFEPSLHELANPLFGSRVLDFIKEAGVQIDFLEIPEAYRMIIPKEKIDITVPHGIKGVIDSIEEFVPGSRDSVSRYMDLCLEVVEALDYLEDNSPRKILSKHGNFVRTGSATVQQVADSLKVPKKAQHILHGYWSYLGTPVDRLSFSLWAVMIAQYFSAPAIFPKNRSHEISSAFIAKIEELGGDIYFNNHVDRIIVKNGAVVGVKVSAGKEYFSEKIISNASPTNVYNRLIYPQKAVPLRAFRNINSRKQGFSFYVVYLGLDIDHNELGLSEYSYIVAPHSDTGKLYKDSADLANKEPFMIGMCLNSANPDCSPPGTTILSLTSPAFAKSWEGISGDNYFEKKGEVAEKMINYFEKSLNVNLKDHIEEIEVATPQTFARYTGSHDGVVYGYQSEPWDSIIPRELFRKKESYFKGLTFCGSYTRSSHGYASSMLSGKQAVERAFSGGVKRPRGVK